MALLAQLRPSLPSSALADEMRAKAATFRQILERVHGGGATGMSGADVQVVEPVGLFRVVLDCSGLV